MVAAAVGHLASRATHEPLTRDVPRTAVLIGVALMIGSLATQVVNHIAHQLISQLQSDETWFFSWQFNVDLTLPAVGIAFLVIAAILRAATRLQRDVEGLV